MLLKARIKKIMQTDEDVGKVAAAVPVIICILACRNKTFDLFETEPRSDFSIPYFLFKIHMRYNTINAHEI